MRSRIYRRRGISLVQWCVMAALITLAIVAGVANIGPRASTKLNQTATDVANPANLTTRFGS
jgi:Flp pilus assembly pilin Flp